MKRVMIDLETLGLGSDSVIISIGAVEFDENPLLSGLGREFYMVVNQRLQENKWKRTIDHAAVKWWATQPDEARKVVLESDRDGNAPMLDTALSKFTEWLAGQHIEIWGNGANFDNVILANAYAAVSGGAPWSFRMDRCYRTLRALSPVANDIPFVGTAHNALDDAKYQAYNAIQYLRRLPK